MNTKSQQFDNSQLGQAIQVTGDQVGQVGVGLAQLVQKGIVGAAQFGGNEIKQAMKMLTKERQPAAAVSPLAPTTTPTPTVTMTPQQNAAFLSKWQDVPQTTQAPMQAVKAAATQAGATPYQQNITIPNSQTGVPTRIPNDIAQVLMNSFDSTNEATNAAKVLSHPANNPYLGPNSSDPPSVDHITHGENASFKTSNIDAVNSDGSIDRGLMRINSNTFSGMMSNPVTRATLAKKGITSFDDMNDPQKNADVAAIIKKNGGWQRWFAAPRNLRAND